MWLLMAAVDGIAMVSGRAHVVVAVGVQDEGQHRNAG